MNLVALVFVLCQPSGECVNYVRGLYDTTAACEAAALAALDRHPRGVTMIACRPVGY